MIFCLNLKSHFEKLDNCNARKLKKKKDLCKIDPFQTSIIFINTHTHTQTRTHTNQNISLFNLFFTLRNSAIKLFFPIILVYCVFVKDEKFFTSALYSLCHYPVRSWHNFFSLT